ncbi:hypothetical protein D9615_001822 [Tricholomella constricta]|uniref:NYN domain-containing protein n=1 Tax=Tricholomella constricta TaxID=117010 RepID=A0A8H5MA82_9AGAR|nr:hypothetical protein D9615_001822 [Tricholomella constricta]
MRPEDVAIFWDYENCHAASHFTGYEIVKKVRSVAHNFGTIKLFKAYLQLSDPATFSKSLALRSELQSSGVSLTDCPHNGRKDVADKMMLVDMLAYAIDKAAPSTIIVISGDRDFAYAVSILRLRRYRVVIISLQGVHTSLKVQASVFLDWNADVLGAEVVDDYMRAGNGPIPRMEERQAPFFTYHKDTPTPGRRNFPLFLQRGIDIDTEESDVDIMYHLHNNRGNGVHRIGSVGTNAIRDDVEGSLRVTNSYSQSRTSSSRQDDIEDENYVPVLRSPSRTESAPAALYTDDTSLTPTVVNKPFSAIRRTRGPDAEHIVNSKAPGAPPPAQDAKGSTFHQESLPPMPSQAFKGPASSGIQLTHSPHLMPITRDMPINSSSAPLNNPFAQLHPLAVGAPSSSAFDTLEVKTPSTTAKGHASTAPLESKVVQPLFKLLVQRLEFHRAKDFFRPFRSVIAVELATQDNTLYRRARVERFGQYVALAEKAGIIELGGREGGAWIALRPEWYDAKTN